MSKLRRRRGFRAGFTMIELLTVIGIIVILMSILIPVVSKIRQQAQVTDTTHLLTKIAEACHNYYQEFRSYPGPLPDTAIHGYSLAISADTPTKASAGFGAALGLSNSAATSAGEYNYNTAVPPVETATGVTYTDVTSSENLVLGLLGGFVSVSSPAPGVVYDNTLVGRGPITLNPLITQQYPSYLDVGKYDLSQDGGGNYSSAALMGSNPAITPPWAAAGTYLIPEFVDHFSQPSPIIYLRARAGATNACDIAPAVSTGTVAPSLGSQYYSAEMAPYAPNFFVQPDRYNNFTTLYGANTSGGPTNGYGLNFFGGQALNNGGVNQNSTARGQDSFILISAGYDGLFGTKDDIVLPSN